MPAQVSHGVLGLNGRMRVRVCFFSSSKVFFLAEMKEDVERGHGKENLVDVKGGRVGKELDSLYTYTHI